MSTIVDLPVLSLDLAARAAELHAAWAFKCRRFNVTISVVDFGDGYPLVNSFYDPAEHSWEISLNAWLSPEVHMAQIAATFEGIAMEYATPEQAAATHARRLAEQAERARDLASWKWGDIPTMPEWLREGFLRIAEERRREAEEQEVQMPDWLEDAIRPVVEGLPDLKRRAARSAAALAAAQTLRNFGAAGEAL